jgi:uncharacterized protein YecT (DUF1311 family)
MRALGPAILICLAAPLAAQDIDCSATMVQFELNQCAYADWQAADAALNTAWQAALAVAKGWDAGLPAKDQGAATALRDGQRAWITFRDLTCEAEGFAMRGGSAEPLVVFGCMRALTLDRTRQLEAMVEAAAP